jgi:murein L,D-transpeptidase YafK
MPATAPEAHLLVALDHLNAGRADAALANLSLLTRQQPDFRLAQYLYASLLDARSGRPTQDLGADTGQMIASLSSEAQRRWAHRLGRGLNGLIPQSLLALPRKYRYAVVVDLGASRLYVLENTPEGLRLVRDHYSSIGRAGIGKELEGDGRTPVGIYHVTEYLDGDALPDLYGAGAYPVNYPNAWDRRLGRTGYGIWVHGVPSDTYSRVPLASEGCVALANLDFEGLGPFIKPGETPVILVDSIQWVRESDSDLLAASLRGQVMEWRRDWESLDTDAYLSHYAEDFSADGMTRAAFVEHKRLVNSARSFVQIEIDDLELYRYPGVEELLFVARFRQQYVSDDLLREATKSQYWRLTPGGRWEIVEEAAG